MKIIRAFCAVWFQFHDTNDILKIRWFLQFVKKKKKKSIWFDLNKDKANFSV